MGEDFYNCGVCREITSDYRCGGRCQAMEQGILKGIETIDCCEFICKKCWIADGKLLCTDCNKYITKQVRKQKRKRRLAVL